MLAIAVLFVGLTRRSVAGWSRTVDVPQVSFTFSLSTANGSSLQVDTW